MKSVKQGKASPSKQYREPGTVNYGSSANVRESKAKPFSKSKGKSKAKAGAYASYD